MAAAAPESTLASAAETRPDWLGTRVLEERADGTVPPQPTPPDLVDRQFGTIDVLDPPTGEEFEFTTGPVPAEVLARSSWSPECPVAAEDLAYLTMSHYGFDGRLHTGEMIVNAAVAANIVEVFRALHAARFPIEEMRVIRAAEIDAPPTGDGNVTTSFVCRPAVGATNWSQHAYGLAIDVNPFHNPYLKGERVLPELAEAYLDRDRVRPGMVLPGDAVTEAFAAIGWHWGGEWRTLVDWMHFSQNGH